VHPEGNRAAAVDRKSAERSTSMARAEDDGADRDVMAMQDFDARERSELAEERAGWCPGERWATLPRRRARCSDCGRELALVGGSIGVGWGRTRLPRHRAPSGVDVEHASSSLGPEADGG
jgi:hypothetical protein